MQYITSNLTSKSKVSYFNFQHCESNIHHWLIIYAQAHMDRADQKLLRQMSNVGLKLGVCYTVHFSGKLLFSYFHFFSITYLVEITKLKKSFKSIISRKFTGLLLRKANFIAFWGAKTNLLAPCHSIKRPGIFWNDIFKRFLRICDHCKVCQWNKIKVRSLRHGYVYPTPSEMERKLRFEIIVKFVSMI